MSTVEPNQIVSGLNRAKPVLKWAGGKTQLVNELKTRTPKRFNKYIEPFFGGGALFFALDPQNAVISDRNPELISMYQAICDDVDRVIDLLRAAKNEEDYFYATRSKDWRSLDRFEAAARTIYLNRTCFNGLYRVNKKGQFNVPFGKYKNPTILDVNNLHEVSKRLRNAKIVEGDYKTVLRQFAVEGDFIFLDPPYLPISKYSDFKRYTKEQFSEQDHVELAEEVHRLADLGCNVVLTNSNHALVHELYRGYEIEIFQTKRHISSRADRRTGEDVIVSIPAKRRFVATGIPRTVSDRLKNYPPTRYMGSKSKLLEDIWSVASQFEYDHVLDLFSGSGIVSYMFKAQGKAVLSNDYMAFSANLSKALIENPGQVLPYGRAVDLVENKFDNDGFVSKTFDGLYYEAHENAFIDSMRAGISKIRNPYQRAIAMAALIRSCIKKRPRGIFTYTGMRYDDGRRDLKMDFADHFLAAVDSLNSAVFDNGRKSRSRNGDALTVRPVPNSLVYLDPPYYSPYSDNEYVRRYHFVEGLARDWDGIEIQDNTRTKKFRSYPTPFSTRDGAYRAFDGLFHRHRDAVILVSYSSNSLPTAEEMVDMMSRYKRQVEVIPIAYRYSFGNQRHKILDNKNQVFEYLFIGY